MTNNGSITSQLGDNLAFAVNLSQAGAVANAGSIIANGGAGAVNLFGSSGFTNSGTVDATGTGVGIYASRFDNSGRISSSGGIGADLPSSARRPTKPAA